MEGAEEEQNVWPVRASSSKRKKNKWAVLMGQNFKAGETNIDLLLFLLLLCVSLPHLKTEQ